MAKYEELANAMARCAAELFDGVDEDVTEITLDVGKESRGMVKGITICRPAKEATQ